MKLLLIRPPAHHAVEAEVPAAVRQENVSYPPLPLIAIHAYLTRHTAHQVSILDGLVDGMSYPALQRAIEAHGPDVVGISAYTLGLVDVVKTVAVARSAKVPHVLLGGPHVNDFPVRSATLPGVDAAIRGEGQATLPAVLDALEAGEPLEGLPGVVTARSALEAGQVAAPRLSNDLDDYPLLDLDAIDYRRYYDLLGGGGLFTTIVTSRGCPHRCTFCNTPRDRFVSMSPGRICEEVEHKLRRGIREIYFVDDTFNVTNDRVAALCEEILRRKLSFRWTARFRANGIQRDLLVLMKRAGCVRVQVGVEQSTDEALRILQKDVTVSEIRRAFRLCRDVGINTVAYFMIGTPAERTRRDVLRTIDFSIELDPDFVMYNILTPFPGTRLFEQGLARGILRAEPWETFMAAPSDTFVPPVWDEFFDARELAELLELAYRRFYFRPRVVARNLRGLASWGGFVKKAKAGLRLLVG